MRPSLLRAGATALVLGGAGGAIALPTIVLGRAPEPALVSIAAPPPRATTVIRVSLPPARPRREAQPPFPLPAAPPPAVAAPRRGTPAPQAPRPPRIAPAPATARERPAEPAPPVPASPAPVAPAQGAEAEPEGRAGLALEQLAEHPGKGARAQREQRKEKGHATNAGPKGKAAHRKGS